MSVFIKAKQTLSLDKSFNWSRLWIDDIDRDPIVLSDSIDKLIGFGMEPTGIETKDFVIGINLERHINQDHILGSTKGDGNIIE